MLRLDIRALNSVQHHLRQLFPYQLGENMHSGQRWMKGRRQDVIEPRDAHVFGNSKGVIPQRFENAFGRAIAASENRADRRLARQKGFGGKKAKVVVVLAVNLGEVHIQTCYAHGLAVSAVSAREPREPRVAHKPDILVPEGLQVASEFERTLNVVEPNHIVFFRLPFPQNVVSEDGEW